MSTRRRLVSAFVEHQPGSISADSSSIRLITAHLRAIPRPIHSRAHIQCLPLFSVMRTRLVRFDNGRISIDSLCENTCRDHSRIRGHRNRNRNRSETTALTIPAPTAAASRLTPRLSRSLRPRSGSNWRISGSVPNWSERYSSRSSRVPI